MITAEILSEWAGDGLSVATAHRPLFASHYPGVRWGETTSTESRSVYAPATGTGLLVIAITCDEATYATIEIDPRYDGRILWSETV